jgi:hypothetical protein
MSIANLAPLLADDFLSAAVSMVKQAKHSLRIYTPDMEPLIYDRPDFIRATSDLARRHKSTLIQILVLDANKIARQTHRLVELYRRLPSSIAIRQVHEDYLTQTDAFLIVDEVAMIRRRNAEQWKGFAEFKSIPLAQRNARLFVEMWERSSEAPALRRLSL